MTAGYMVGPEEMQDRKGHCPMMVTVDVKLGEPGDDEDDEQGSDEEGVSLPPKLKWPEEGDERWQQWGQRVHVEMRKGSQVHQAMRSAARVWEFNKQGGESQAQPKLQRLVATLRKRQHEELEARAQEEGAEWQTEVTQAKKRVRAARRAVEEEHERIYQKVGAGRGRTGGQVLQTQQGGGAGPVASPADDGMGFPTATMRATDARGQWWGMPLRLPKEVQECEEAQGEMEVWWGEEEEGKRAGVQLGWDTVRGLQEEDDVVAVSFRMTDTGRPDEEAPIVSVGHKCGESARRIRLTVHWLPADRVWYLVLVQAYLEQGRAKGDRAWCHGMVVMKGWKARTHSKWAVYRGLRELSMEYGIREYGIGRHKVYCHYPREVVRILQPTEERVVLFLDGSRPEGQLTKAGAAAVRVSWLGQVTESVVEKMVYGAASHGEVQAVEDVVGEIGEEIREVLMVVNAEADMASLRRLAGRTLHEALGTGLASQVYAIWHGLEMKTVPLVILLVKQESHRAAVGNHEADGAAQAVDKEQEPEWRVPERKENLHLVHIPPRAGEEEKARWAVEEERGKQELRVYPQPVHMLDSSTRGAGGGRTERVLGGQGGTAGPLPQCAEAGNTAQKAANQKAAGNHEAGAGAGNNHAVVQT